MKSDIDRSSVQPLVVALLCILAVGLAAATLTTAYDSTPGGGTVFEPPESGSGGEAINQQGNRNSNSNATAALGGSSIPLSMCYEPLASPAGTGVFLLAFLVLVGVIYYRFSFSAALLGGWTAFPVFMLVYFLVTNCPTAEGEQSGIGRILSGAPGPGETFLSVESIPPWVLGVIIGGVLIGAVALLYQSVGEDETVIQEHTSNEPELDQFAAAAGRAADRIEEHNAGVDNAVYRAWVEMTGLFDVERADTYSAGEFADAAIDLGMMESDVRELTRLFNEVRYGGKDIGSRENRAVSVLRSIESAYSAPDVNIDSDDVPNRENIDGDEVGS